MNGKIKIGTNFSPFIKRNDLKTVLEKITNIGFDATEFSLGRLYGIGGEYGEKEFFSEIRKFTEDLGLELCQAHSPFERNDYSAEYFLSKPFIDEQIRAIRRASILNIPYLIVHPYTPEIQDAEHNKFDYSHYKDFSYNVNMEFFAKLKPYFSDYGVKCAIENLAGFDFITRSTVETTCSTSKELKKYIKDLGDDIFCACYDSGHANLIAGESHKEFIENLGKDLKCLHLNDNFGIKNDWFGELDRHLPPFFGCVKWDEIKEGLDSIGFDGVYNFECINYMPNDKFDFLFAEYILKSGKEIFGK